MCYPEQEPVRDGAGDNRPLRDCRDFDATAEVCEPWKTMVNPNTGILYYYDNECCIVQ